MRAARAYYGFDDNAASLMISPRDDAQPRLTAAARRQMPPALAEQREYYIHACRLAAALFAVLIVAHEPQMPSAVSLCAAS